MSSASSILTAFNNHFTDFVDDIYSVFPNDHDILTAKNSFSAIRKINPKLIIKCWDMYVAAKYSKEIEAGNMDFFINKDYSTDIDTVQNSDKIVEAINRLRNPIKNMTDENKKKIVKYIQNLSKLSSLYNEKNK